MFTLKAPFAIISMPNLMKGAFTMNRLENLVLALLYLELKKQGKSNADIAEILNELDDFGSTTSSLDIVNQLEAKLG